MKSVEFIFGGFKQFGTTVHQVGGGGTNMGQRQLSVVSDSRLLDDEIKQEVKVILRPKRPPRPQSEVFLDKVDGTRRSKRYSAFGVSSCLLLRENNIGEVNLGASLAMKLPF